MRKLASIQRISNIEPIPGADMICKATVLGWELVVKKDEFQIGDMCVYCEIDSVLPEREEFNFLRDRKYRIKTIKLKGQISQGICFPISILPDGFNPVEGDNVTNVLGITKWEPYSEEQEYPKQVRKYNYPSWMPQWMQRFIHRFKFVRLYYKAKSKSLSFPAFIPKTDETRVQVLQPLLTKYAGTECYVTEKLDGSSITIYLKDGKFGVCSRNMDLAKDVNNRFWSVVIKHDIEKKMMSWFTKENIAIQGELIGPGIQGNKYKLKELDVYFFNAYFINAKRYASLNEFTEVIRLIDEKTVPILSKKEMLQDSIPVLVEMSKGESVLYPTMREGIVIRPVNEIVDNDLHCQLVRNRVSFKSVNPDFLLKHNE